MAKPITVTDAQAGGLAAYTLMQSLLVNLDTAGVVPRKLLLQVISDSAMLLELTAQQTKPASPALKRAVKILQATQQKWEAKEPRPTT